MEYSEVVEVVETRLGLVNSFLGHGYKLLAIQSVSKPEAGPDGKGLFVPRRIQYVLGRSAAVPAWKPERPAKEPAKPSLPKVLVEV